jgi:hypothetical protein
MVLRCRFALIGNRFTREIVPKLQYLGTSPPDLKGLSAAETGLSGSALPFPVRTPLPLRGKNNHRALRPQARGRLVSPRQAPLYMGIGDRHPPLPLVHHAPPRPRRLSHPIAHCCRDAALRKRGLASPRQTPLYMGIGVRPPPLPLVHHALSPPRRLSPPIVTAPPLCRAAPPPPSSLPHCYRAALCGNRPAPSPPSSITHYSSLINNYPPLLPSHY